MELNPITAGDMNNYIGIIAVVALIGLMVSCEAWKWGECKKVGHGTFYCLTKVGGKD